MVKTHASFHPSHEYGERVMIHCAFLPPIHALRSPTKHVCSGMRLQQGRHYDSVLRSWFRRQDPLWTAFVRQAIARQII
ncbi:hypothetical protein BDZ97DRAFT_1790500 [Flammula alnicola]|nr:hypothetical protein BDZ97DRAFT_1790500 [Flammula alnicola]